jgi:TRAP-type C4-dicarboxylate transport system permease small subunit
VKHLILEYEIMKRTPAWMMRMDKGIGWLSRVGMAIGMGWVLLMMFLTTLDVVLRYFFSSPIPGALEVSEIMLAIFGILGIAYTHGAGANVRVAMLVEKLPVRAAAVLNLLTGLLSFQIIVMLVWYGVVMGVEEYQFGTTTDSLKIPLYPLHFLLPVGALLLSLEIVKEMIASLSEIITGHDLQ